MIYVLSGDTIDNYRRFPKILAFHYATAKNMLLCYLMCMSKITHNRLYS